MAKSIHFICEKLTNGQPKNVKHISGTKTFSSGYWNISEQEAKALIGGWLYLHATKAEPSYRGGRISSFENTIREDVARTNRITLIFQPMINGIGQTWRGKDHTMAWTSGLVDANLDHENT